MRLVMGDLSWKVQAEPAEYTYAAYLKAELPHKEDEAAMIEEVSKVSSFCVGCHDCNRNVLLSTAAMLFALAIFCLR